MKSFPWSFLHHLLGRNWSLSLSLSESFKFYLNLGLFFFFCKKQTFFHLVLQFCFLGLVNFISMFSICGKVCVFLPLELCFSFRAFVVKLWKVRVCYNLNFLFVFAF